MKIREPLFGYLRDNAIARMLGNAETSDEEADFKDILKYLFGE